MDEKSKSSAPESMQSASAAQSAQSADAKQSTAQASPSATPSPSAATAAAIDPEQEKKKRKRLLLILLLLLLLIVAAFAIVFGVLNKNVYDTKASSISYASQSYDEIVKDLNEKTEASRLWISVANTFRVKADGTAYAQTSEGTAVSVIDNIDRNTKDIKYTFYLDNDEGTELKQIYESGLIAPGQSIENPVIDLSGISSGSHEITVTAQGYDTESHLATGGKVSAQVTMTVE